METYKMKLSHIKKLLRKLKPREYPVIVWEEYLGITEEQAIEKYKKDNNIKEFKTEPVILHFTDKP